MDNSRSNANQLCKATFSKGAGAKYLAILKAKFVDCTVYEPQLEHHEVAYREGQRSIIRLIEKELEIVIQEDKDGR